jgi:hypothetical protein
MENAKLTYSESLFQELCTLHGVQCTRLSASQDHRQADYDLLIAGQRIVAEVKQAEPNDADRAFSNALTTKGHAFGRCNPDDKAGRVRNHIATSRGQFRAYLRSNPGIPAILVIFDNTESGYDDPYTVQTAMCGWEQAVISTAGNRPVIVERGFAPRNNSAIRHDKNRHLSALVTMHEFDDFHPPHERKLGLRFYHNEYADVPFPPKLWEGPEISHLRLGPKEPGQFQDWIPLT